MQNVALFISIDGVVHDQRVNGCLNSVSRSHGLLTRTPRFLCSHDLNSVSVCFAAKSIEINSHEQAVSYFKMASKFLQQYKHIKTFDQIRQQSEGIIQTLKEKLKRSVSVYSSAYLSSRLSTAVLRPRQC